MAYLENLINNFLHLRTSRKISAIMLLSIIVTAQVVSICSMVAISNTLDIISEVRVPDEYIEANFDLNNQEDMEIVIPYYIKNPGMYDLNDIVIKVEITVEYIHNLTKKEIEEEIFSKKSNLGKCRAMTSLDNEFAGDVLDFDLVALNKFFTYFDINNSISMSVSIELKAKYFYDLIEFTILDEDIDLLDYECPYCSGED